MMTSEIRLGCLSCNRDDHVDGIDSIPLDWSDVGQIQSYAESNADVDPDDPLASVLDWETHLGVCPECQENVKGRRTIFIRGDFVLGLRLLEQEEEIKKLKAENDQLRAKIEYLINLPIPLPASYSPRPRVAPEGWFP